MQKLVIFLFTLLFSTQLFAGWSKLVEDKVATEYINFDTKQQIGTVVKMWNMSDFKSKQAVGNGQLYQSSKAQQEYDCFTHSKRLISLIHYQSAMGKGKVVFLDANPSKWRKIQAGSLSEAHLNAACTTN